MLIPVRKKNRHIPWNTIPHDQNDAKLGEITDDEEMEVVEFLEVVPS